MRPIFDDEGAVEVLDRYLKERPVRVIDWAKKVCKDYNCGPSPILTITGAWNTGGKAKSPAIVKAWQRHKDVFYRYAAENKVTGWAWEMSDIPHGYFPVTSTKQEPIVETTPNWQLVKDALMDRLRDAEHRRDNLTDDIRQLETALGVLQDLEGVL